MLLLWKADGNMENFYAVFVAGGSGVRMGADVPKQFLDLGGKPILMRTMERFAEALDNLKIITVLPENCIRMWKDLCLERGFTCPQILVKGGITRFHSVKNALESVPDDAVVLIHDGVRPFVSADLIRSLADMAANGRNAIPVCPVTDTVKTLVPAESKGEFMDSGMSLPDRKYLFGAQTPQAFPAATVRRAYADTPYDPSYTDDASVLAANKIPLTYVAGERYNIKITTPEDLELARRLV